MPGEHLINWGAAADSRASPDQFSDERQPPLQVYHVRVGPTKGWLPTTSHPCTGISNQILPVYQRPPSWTGANFRHFIEMLLEGLEEARGREGPSLQGLGRRALEYSAYIAAKISSLIIKKTP